MKIPENVPALEVRIVPVDEVIEVANDNGTGADKELHLYRPNEVVGGSKWSHLGVAANIRENLILVRELVPGALSQAQEYREIWRDAGTGGPRDFSIWEIVPPAGYRALGSVGHYSYKEPWGYVCVHESICVQGWADSVPTWDDGGSGADLDVFIWRILAGPDGLSSNSFVAANSNPHADLTGVYVLNKKRIKIVES